MASPTSWAGLFAAGAALAGTPAPGQSCAHGELLAPDRSASARIERLGGELACGESRVRILAGGRQVAEASYGSADGEHGYGVSSASWTPDSRYFVFEVVSSGGHQPLNNPIYVFDTAARRLAPLPLPDGFIPSAFRLLAGDRLSVRVWDVGQQAPTRVLVRLAERRGGKAWARP